MSKNSTNNTKSPNNKNSNSNNNNNSNSNSDKQELMSLVNLIVSAKNAEKAGQNEKTLFIKYAKEDDVKSVMQNIEKYKNFKDAMGNSILHIAVSILSIKVCKYLLENKIINANIKNNSQDTPLHLLCRRNAESSSSYNCVEVLKLLVENGADVNAINSEKDTPLLLATLYSYNPLSIEFVKKLIAAGADVNYLTEKEYGEISRMVSPFTNALYSDPLVDYFLSLDRFKLAFKCVKGDFIFNTNVNYLNTVIDKGLNRLTKKIIEKNIEDTFLIAYDNPWFCEWSPLHLAAKNRTISDENFRLLAKKMSELNLIDRIEDQRRTALHICAEFNAVEKFKILLEYEADIDIKGKDQKNVLHYFVNHNLQSKSFDILDIAIENGVDNDEDKYGIDPVSLAWLRQDHKLYKVLCKKFSVKENDFSRKNSKGDNILHLAVKWLDNYEDKYMEEYNYEENISDKFCSFVIDTIKQYPDLINEYNNEGDTFIHLFLKYYDMDRCYLEKYDDIIQLCLAAMQPDLPDKEKNNYLHVLLQYLHLPWIRTYVEKFFTIILNKDFYLLYEVNNKNETPIQLIERLELTAIKSELKQLVSNINGQIVNNINKCFLTLNAVLEVTISKQNFTFIINLKAKTTDVLLIKYLEVFKQQVLKINKSWHFIENTLEINKPRNEEITALEHCCIAFAKNLNLNSYFEFTSKDKVQNINADTIKTGPSSSKLAIEITQQKESKKKKHKQKKKKNKQTVTENKIATVQDNNNSNKNNSGPKSQITSNFFPSPKPPKGGIYIEKNSVNNLSPEINHLLELAAKYRDLMKDLIQSNLDPIVKNEATFYYLILYFEIHYNINKLLPENKIPGILGIKDIVRFRNLLRHLYERLELGEIITFISVDDFGKKDISQDELFKKLQDIAHTNFVSGQLFRESPLSEDEFNANINLAITNFFSIRNYLDKQISNLNITLHLASAFLNIFSFLGETYRRYTCHIDFSNHKLTDQQKEVLENCKKINPDVGHNTENLFKLKSGSMIKNDDLMNSIDELAKQVETNFLPSENSYTFAPFNAVP